MLRLRTCTLARTTIFLRPMGTIPKLLNHPMIEAQPEPKKLTPTVEPGALRAQIVGGGPGRFATGIYGKIRRVLQDPSS
jgi:hypothetical protein